MDNITLIVPYFNEEKTLESCIVSILNQSELPSEVVFVDNDSSDNSSSIVNDYLPNFRVPTKMIQEKKKGIPFARNRGVIESKSNIVAFLDSDCTAPEDYIESFKRGFEQNVHAVTGRYILVGQDANIAIYRQLVWEKHFGWDKGVRVITSLDNQDGTIVSGCSAFSKDALVSLGLFDTMYLFMDDIAISEKFYRRGYKAIMNPTIEVQHRVDTNEISIFKKDLHYGYDHALINLHIRGRRIRFYPSHYKNILNDLAQTMGDKDPLAFYRLRTLVYHKIGLFIRGLSIGGLYL